MIPLRAVRNKITRNSKRLEPTMHSFPDIVLKYDDYHVFRAGVGVDKLFVGGTE